MELVVKKGNILSEPERVPDIFAAVGYTKEGGSPLFIIREHGGVVLLMIAEDEGFEEALKLLGI